MRNIFRGKNISLRIALYSPILLLLIYAGFPTYLDFAINQQAQQIKEKNKNKITKTVELIKFKVDYANSDKVELSVYYVEYNVSKVSKLILSPASFDFIRARPIDIDPTLTCCQLECQFQEQNMTDMISITCPSYEKSNQIIEHIAGE